MIQTLDQDQVSEGIAAPSPSYDEEWHLAAFVPDHSGGPVPDSHRVPFSAPPPPPLRERRGAPECRSKNLAFTKKSTV